MPKILREFLENLPIAEAGAVAEWLDETANPEVEMVKVMYQALKKTAPSIRIASR